MPTLHAWCSIPARFIVPFVLLMACVQTSEAAEAVIAEAPIELDELQNAPTPAEALAAYEHELETLYQQYDAAVNLAAEAQGYTADEDYCEIVIDYTEALIEDVSMELELLQSAPADAFAQAPPTGTEAPESFNPLIIGD